VAYDAIYPGRPWLDTNGRRIQAHGGSLFAAGDTVYWYGENKERSLPGSGIWHWGVRCYSSKDLYNWEDLGLIIPPLPDEPGSPLHPASFLDRPHIIYNEKTSKYVAWLKIMQPDGGQSETVLTADTFTGPYTIVKRDLKPLGMNAGDLDLVVDCATGKAYYYFEKVHTELICAELTDDYTDVSGVYSSHFPLGQPPFVREAPAHFTRGGKHYLFTSGTTGYHPNPTMVAMADDWHGPWVDLGDPHIDDPSRTSFNTQISSVFKVPWKKDLYITIGDRWIADLAERAGDAYGNGRQYELVAELFERMFKPGPNTAHGPADLSYEMKRAASTLENINTSIADYVWLPVEFEGDKPVLRWQDSWRLEDYE